MKLRGHPARTFPSPPAGRETAETSRAALAAELAAVVAGCHARGWCHGTAGNFSAVLRRRPLILLITPSGVDKGAVRAGDLLAVGGDGLLATSFEDARPDPAARPSAETALHCAILQTLGAGAVLHTHSVAGTLLGEHFLERGGLRIRDYEMLKGLRGLATHAAEAFVPVLANSQDMQELGGRVRALAAGTPGLHGFLLAGHGLYTWGEDLAEARRHLEILEFLFEVVARKTRYAPFEGR
jgi:methylthioribulose-1-phosphate dehydratase